MMSYTRIGLLLAVVGVVLVIGSRTNTPVRTTSSAVAVLERPPSAAAATNDDDGASNNVTVLFSVGGTALWQVALSGAGDAEQLAADDCFTGDLKVGPLILPLRGWVPCGLYPCGNGSPVASMQSRAPSNKDTTTPRAAKRRREPLILPLRGRVPCGLHRVRHSDDTTIPRAGRRRGAPPLASDARARSRPAAGRSTSRRWSRCGRAPPRARSARSTSRRAARPRRPSSWARMV